MLSATASTCMFVFAIVFALGAGLAGFAGVVGGSALSVAPGEDVRYLLASLVVVIVGGMGSITGAAIGALLIGLAEQVGLVYFPTYGIVLTFVIMVAALAIRPQGIMGKRNERRHRQPTGVQAGRTVPSPIGVGHIVLAALLIVYPAIGSNFFLTQIGAYSLILGMISLSLMLLAGYGGMVSLAQISVAGIAGYTVAVFGLNNSGVHGFGWPFWVVVPFATLIAAIASALIGWISVRTEGIYTIMITLAIATAFYYFVQQNYSLFNGFPGFAGFGRRNSGASPGGIPTPSITSAWLAAALAYVAVLYAARSTFGLALQATRDNPAAHARARLRRHGLKVVAYFLAGLIAGTRRRPARLVQRPHLAGHGRCRRGDRRPGHRRHRRHPPSDRAVHRRGRLRPVQTFAIDIVGAERFNTLIGLFFLAIVFVSPDGSWDCGGRSSRILPRDRSSGSVTGLSG